MKKIKIFSLVMMICFYMIGAVKAVTVSDECRLEYGMSSIKSKSVGTSKRGVFETSTDADSSGISYTFCHCAWVGYPYTIEYKFETPRGKTVQHTEYQSEKSNFYTQVTSSMGNRTKATGRVKAL